MTSRTAFPLRPDPLRPLKEKNTGRNGRGLECPPAASVVSACVGHDGTQRDATTAETARPLDRWTLALAGLLGQPWPALPALPGRRHVCFDDDEPERLPAWALLTADELAQRDGITRHAAHIRLKKARQVAREATAASEAEEGPARLAIVGRPTANRTSIARLHAQTPAPAPAPAARRRA